MNLFFMRWTTTLQWPLTIIFHFFDWRCHKCFIYVTILIRRRKKQQRKWTEKELHAYTQPKFEERKKNMNCYLVVRVWTTMYAYCPINVYACACVCALYFRYNDRMADREIQSPLRFSFRSFSSSSYFSTSFSTLDILFFCGFSFYLFFTWNFLCHSARCFSTLSTLYIQSIQQFTFIYWLNCSASIIFLFFMRDLCFTSIHNNFFLLSSALFSIAWKE